MAADRASLASTRDASIVISGERARDAWNPSASRPIARRAGPAESTGHLAHGHLVTLWQLENRHVGPLHQLVSDLEVRQTWRTRGNLWAPFQLQAFLGRDVLISAVATLGDEPTDPVVGLAEILDASFVDSRAQLSLVVGAEHLGTGLGVDLALTFLDFVFDAYPLDKICIEVHADNDRLAPGLRRVISYEGTFKRHINIRGHWIDVDAFALWRSDMPALNRRLRRRSAETT